MKILISTSSFAQEDRTSLSKIIAAGYEVVTNPYGRTLRVEECLSLYTDAVGVIAGTEPITRKVLAAAKQLRVISRCGAGLDNVDGAAAQELGIAVFNTPDGPTLAVAELTVALMLDLLRAVSWQDRQVRKGQWKKEMGCLLSGKTLGILGLGRIGRKVVELTQPFSLHYLAWDQKPAEEFLRAYRVQATDIETVLAQSDIVSLHLPYTPELHHRLGARELALLKRGALLLNLARGGLVDEGALVAALREGSLGGAALDTYEREPYSGELATLETVVLTCHTGSYAREARIQMEWEAVEHLLAGLHCSGKGL